MNDFQIVLIAFLFVAWSICLSWLVWLLAERNAISDHKQEIVADWKNSFERERTYPARKDVALSLAKRLRWIENDIENGDIELIKEHAAYWEKYYEYEDDTKMMFFKGGLGQMRGNSVVEIQAHNLKVLGSIPSPATKFLKGF